MRFHLVFASSHKYHQKCHSLPSYITKGDFHHNARTARHQQLIWCVYIPECFIIILLFSVGNFSNLHIWLGSGLFNLLFSIANWCQIFKAPMSSLKICPWPRRQDVQSTTPGSVMFIFFLSLQTSKQSTPWNGEVCLSQRWDRFCKLWSTLFNQLFNFPHLPHIMTLR